MHAHRFKIGNPHRHKNDNQDDTELASRIVSGAHAAATPDRADNTKTDTDKFDTGSPSATPNTKHTKTAKKNTKLRNVASHVFRQIPIQQYTELLVHKKYEITPGLTEPRQRKGDEEGEEAAPHQTPYSLPTPRTPRHTTSTKRSKTNDKEKNRFSPPLPRRPSSRQRSKNGRHAETWGFLPPSIPLRGGTCKNTTLLPPSPPQNTRFSVSRCVFFPTSSLMSHTPTPHAPRVEP